MRDRRIAGKETEIDAVLLKHDSRIGMNGDPLAIFAENTGQLEDVSPAVNEDLVLRRGPNQVPAKDVFVHHPSRNAGAPDKVEGLHWTPIFHLQSKVLAVRKDQQGCEQ